MRGYRLISLRQFYDLGGFSNSNLFRRMRDGVWQHYHI